MELGPDQGQVNLAHHELRQAAGKERKKAMAEERLGAIPARKARARRS